MGCDTSSRRDKSTTKPSDREDLLLRGLVERVSFDDRESGFSVLKVSTDDDEKTDSSPKNALITVVGVHPSGLHPGANIVCRGEWQTHPRFGLQFRARSITESPPTSKDAIRRYLGSGSIKGLGPALAARIVDTFGENTLKVLDSHPEKLLDVPGIGRKKYEELLRSWTKKKNLREVLLFFQSHDISATLAERLWLNYGEKAIEKVSRNPYILAREVWGIGFLTADRIAKALGIPADSPERIGEGLVYTLERSSEQGNCYAPRERLVEKTRALLSLDDLERIEEILDRIYLQDRLVEEKGLVYLPRLYRSERELASDIAMRLRPGEKPIKPIKSALLNSFLGNPFVSKDTNSGDKQNLLRLSDEQRKAVRLAASECLTVITGGPGCGKTTVIRSVASLFRRAGLTIGLAAPTGRAAQRLSEICGISASTIHRLLKFDPVSRQFTYTKDEQLPLDALIVDESSMIDLPLAASLFAAMPRGGRIVVVGDSDQLPSVGPGLFLSDLLDTPSVPRVRLTRLFRRSQESAITRIAHEINRRHVPHIPEPDGHLETDAYFVPVTDLEKASSLVERLVVDRIPSKFGYSGADLLVLSPMNKGPLGIKALNKQLQARLVPERARLPFVNVGNLQFRLGDHVCQRVNNYNIAQGGVFNGDRGEIVGIDSIEKHVYVKLWDGREVKYSGAALHQLDLAYAITIHRSQGSEVPAVVLVLHDSHNILLERQLIYTAVTRAKKLLVIVGTRRALKIAVGRSRGKKRYSGLKNRLEHLLSETPSR